MTFDPFDDGPVDYSAFDMPAEPPPDAAFVSVDEAARVLGISRDTIDRMVRAAPASLPGAPVDFGTGKKRLLRFRADAVVAWAEAYRAWKATSARPATSTRPALPRKRRPAKGPATEGTGKITLLEVERVRRKG